MVSGISSHVPTDPVIFMHIPKNGGTTFQSILNWEYRNRCVFTIKVINGTEMNTAEFFSKTQVQKDSYDLVKGHHIYGLHEQFSKPSTYITFLRDPIERVVSFYNYVLNRPRHRLYDFLTKKNVSLREFAVELDEKDTNNAQVYYLSGVRADPDIMLEKAIQNIARHFPVVGTLDRFDESLILLKRYFNWKYPLYSIRNKSRSIVGIDSIDKDTLEEIRHLNKEDYMLLEYINSRIDKQINEHHSGFEADLKRFSSLNRVFQRIPIGYGLRQGFKRMVEWIYN